MFNRRGLKRAISFFLFAALAITVFPLSPVHAIGGDPGASYDMGIVGWDGDKDAPFIYRDGSFWIRDGRNISAKYLLYPFNPEPANARWYLNEGYLPVQVIEFEKNNSTVKFMTFADKENIGGNDYEVVYSRVQVYNHGSTSQVMDPQAQNLLPLPGNPSTTVPAGQTYNFDYAIASDRFGNAYNWPADSDVINAGSWDTHYAHMKNYWNNLLSSYTQLNQLPDQKLIDAYKAGIIWTHIIKDGTELHVGEGGYDATFDHDSIGIAMGLMTAGDMANAQTYLQAIAAQLTYDDAKWKYAWPWAYYLLKTGDTAYVSNNFQLIHDNAHKIATDRTGPNGILKSTFDIDYQGYWLVDNWSGLMGLTAYKYISERLGNTTEAAWAQSEYDSLLNSCNLAIQDNISTHGLNYMPIAMLDSNDVNSGGNPRTLHWTSQLEFGQWGWDGYLFNLNQSGTMIDLIDPTYDYGLARGEANGLYPHSLGGTQYATPSFMSAYNAGSASSGLRGTRYRSEAIYAYQAMIGYGMSSPFGWWEGVSAPVSSPLEGNWAVGYGFGSSPHMWGQSMATKSLLDSLIAEKVDGKIIIGRGVPNEWLMNGKVIDISNYYISGNKRVGFKIEGLSNNQVKLTLTGATANNDILFQLPAFLNNIASTTAGTIDNVGGTVTIPASTSTVTVTLTNGIFGKNLAAGKTATMSTGYPSNGNPANAVDNNTNTFAQSSSNIPWDLTIDLGSVQKINRLNVTTDKTNYAQDYQIQVSTNGTNYSTVDWQYNMPGGPKSHLFNLTDARYVRIHQTKIVGGGTSWGPAIREVEVYNDKHYSNDLALGATVTMLNGTPGSNGALFNAVDGTGSTFAQSNANVNWGLQVDLGNSQKIGKVAVNTDATNYASQYTIQASTDNVNWTTVATENSGNGTPKTYTFTPINARYVKMNVTAHVGGGSTYGHAIREFEVYAPNLAQGALTTMLNGTPVSNGAAGNATDGNSSTFAQSNANVDWDLQVDLGSARTISRAVVNTDATNYATQYTIQASTDNVNWTTVATEDSGNGTPRTYTFAPINARYVKMNVTAHVGGGTSYGHAIREFEVYTQ